MTRFDRYVAVDWSASARPTTGTDSIWIADVVDPAQPEAQLTNPPTRGGAINRLVEIFTTAVEAGHRVIVGVDAGFGYPAGTLDRLGCDRWSDLWATIADLVVDDDITNANNRFVAAADLNRRLGPAPGPFWGAPTSQSSDDLSTTKASFPHVDDDRPSLDEYRACDRRLNAAGHRVQSVWKLYTTGSVGGQTLLAITRLEQLRSHPELGPHVAIWPFEIDATTLDRRPLIVVAEMWPAGFTGPAHWIRDAAQVNGAARRLAELDRDGRLDDLLLLTAVIDQDADLARREEGWILGAEDPSTILD